MKADMIRKYKEEKASQSASSGKWMTVGSGKGTTVRTDKWSE